ncbi:MAG: hypothetical protein ACLQJR_07200 [Stellaceae bacterium]
MNTVMRDQWRASLAAWIAAVAIALVAPAQAESAREHVGQVHFPISCSAPAQQQFDRAVAMLHSFWYPEAAKTFAAVGETDPGCAMAQWGVAMSVWYPLWYPPSEASLKMGAAAVEKARSIGAKTDRERDYIEAIGAFYKDWGTSDHRARSIAYEKAMEQIYLRYPDDLEAAVFYALALDATAPPTDKTYANQRKAAAILEKAQSTEPDHPGIAHYLIHSYDSAALAEQGLPAARRYAAIAPAVPHALHMPSHIFTRLGLWQESIASNEAAHERARSYAEENGGPGAFDGETLHTMDYLEYAYLQGAQDGAAKRVVDELGTLRKGPSILVTAYAIAAIPARYVLERRSWSDAASLAMPDIPFAWERFPWAEALNAFTRALGAARTGDQSGAEREIARLRALEDKLIASQDKYWADQVEVQRLAATGMAKRAQGNDADAIQLVRAAADLESAMDKHPVTPAAILPARELLADLLLELDRPTEAMVEYQRTLDAEPKRFRSLLGAARASERLEAPARAREFYAQLVAQCDKADTQRPELVEAKAYLTQH